MYISNDITLKDRVKKVKVKILYSDELSINNIY